MTSVISYLAASQEATVAAAVITVLVVVTTWREEEEDKKGKVKKSHFSKHMGVVLERENKFFLGRKEENSKLLREEVGWFFFGRIISFGVGRTKVGSLNLIMTGIFLKELIIASLFDLTWLIFSVGTPHHGLKVGLWISSLEISPK